MREYQRRRRRNRRDTDRDRTHRYRSRAFDAMIQRTLHLEQEYYQQKQGRNNTSAKKQDAASTDRTFVEDTFTLMILSEPRSKSWALGLSSASLQLAFWSLLFYNINQENNSNCNDEMYGTVKGIDCTKGMPFYVPVEVTFAQAFSIPLVVLMQGDIVTAVENLSTLWYSHRIWENVIFRRDKFDNDTIMDNDSDFEDENGSSVRKSGTCSMWIARILVPCMLQLIVGIMSLAGSFLLIAQSSNVLDLLKDFAALLVVNGIDDIAFQAAARGQFGVFLSTKAADAKTVRYQDNRSSCFRISTWFLPMVAMYFTWLVVVVYGQRSGNIMRRKYKDCYARNLHLLGDGICNDEHWDGVNNAECGWDGADCVVADYPKCHTDPRWVGDGFCQEHDPYNTEECGYDGGDCILESVPGYPECFVKRPREINNGICEDYPPYNTMECGYDGEDCVFKSVQGFPDCFVEHPEWIGDGECDSFPPYNTVECGLDGGDCPYYPVEGLDGCYVHYQPALGDGYCDSYFQQGNYNSEACGYDMGDCLMEEYPDCVGINPLEIGNGNCRNSTPYNTAECGFDGGDCVA